VNAAEFRAELLARLLPPLQADGEIDACFEGGSAATGRLDEFSDVDLYFVASADHAAAVFSLFESTLASAARIIHVWSVEPSGFAGLSQRHYVLDPAPRCFAVECCVLTPDCAAQFLERERHGEPIVHFDRNGNIGSLPLDRAAQAAKLARRFAQIRSSWPIYRLTVDKEIARRHALDAFGFYINGLVRPLIELAGMRYRPERFDYGWRYLHHDLPAELQQVLTRLAFVSSIDEIEARLPQLDQQMTHLVTEIERRPSILALAALR
jgi:hypothetical protein